VTSLIVVLLLSYLAGSIPTSIVAGRLLAGIDIRTRGSGNAGATNVYRVLGIGPAIAVAVVDVAKGAVAALLISRIQIGMPAPVDPVLLRLLAGGAAVVGHVWTIFAGFRGGKGVATAIGALGGITPAALACSVAVWITLLLSVRIMSVASLGAAVVLPIGVWILERGPEGGTPRDMLWFTSALALLIVFTHRRNIVRLFRGEEPRLGRDRTPEGKQPENELLETTGAEGGGGEP